MSDTPEPKKRGGTRPGAGRPHATDPVQTYTIKLPRSWIREIRDRGLSKTIREAIAVLLGKGRKP